MIFLKAFILGGSLCAVFQLFWSLTKTAPSTLLKIGFCLSALLTPMGITGGLIAFGQCGFFVMVAGAGEAAFSGTLAALGGNIVPLLQLVAVFISIILIGTICALLYHQTHRSQPTEAESPCPKNTA